MPKAGDLKNRTSAKKEVSLSPFGCDNVHGQMKMEEKATFIASVFHCGKN